MDSEERWWKEYFGALAGAGLFLLGLWGYYKGVQGLWHDLSETAIIAGVVTFTVDPWVKKKIIREASKDIFKHLLGIDLPKEIRDSLSSQLFKTENYRKDMRIEAEIANDSDGTVITITQTTRVVAAKNCKYCQRLQAEESERAVLLEASLSQHRDPATDYSINDPSKLQLMPLRGEPMVVQWEGATVELEKGEEVATHLKYQIRRGSFDHAVMNFAAPVVRPLVHVKGPDGLEVTASAAHRQTGNDYLYDKVFLYGDHIQIRWKPKHH